MEKKMTKAEIEKEIKMRGLKRHHSARCREYVSRKSDGYIEDYNGRFGKGLAWHEPAWDSSTYSWVTYYVESDDDDDNTLYEVYYMTEDDTDWRVTYIHDEAFLEFFIKGTKITDLMVWEYSENRNVTSRYI